MNSNSCIETTAMSPGLSVYFDMTLDIMTIRVVTMGATSRIMEVIRKL
jgi:hypothetical protein